MKKVILFTILILNVLSSCRIAKNVPSGYYLLHENEVKLQKTSGSLAVADLEAVIRQQPNQTLLGVPVRLAIFNAVDSSKVAKKRQNKNLKLIASNQEAMDKMDRINDKRIKKARSKGRDFYTEKIIPMKDLEHPRRFLREWLKYKYGEKPVVFDTNLYVKSIEQIRILLKRKGQDGVRLFR